MDLQNLRYLKVGVSGVCRVVYRARLVLVQEEMINGFPVGLGVH